MSEAKIEFSFDNLRFSCEGDKDWVEAQLNQVLGRIPGLNQTVISKPSDNTVTATTDNGTDESGTNSSESDDQKSKGKSNKKIRLLPGGTSEPVVDEPAGDPLHTFLKEKSADKNQVKKFLATAVYMHSKGEERFSTPLVSKSLKTSRIEKLLNASDCLNKNEKKGFCIKDGKDFILTEKGIKSILGNKPE